MPHSFLFLFLSVFAGSMYALQSTLLAKYSRALDGLSVAVYRNGSLMITMLPLLFFAGEEEIQKALHSGGPIVLAGAFGGIGLSLGISSQRYLPVGISSALTQGGPLFLFLWGFLYFHHIPSFGEIGFVMVILLGVFFLIKQPHHLPHLDARTGRGIAFILCSTFLGSLSFFCVNIAVKDISPFAVGYFWEASVGFFALLFAVLRTLVQKIPLKKISLSQLKNIALSASPTVFASVAFPYAMSICTAGIASTVVNATGVLVVTTLGFFWYGEKLKKNQIIGMVIIVAGMAGMRILG